MPKLHLESRQTMGTSLIYASAGCPSNVDNPKQIQLSTCRDLHTFNRISFGRETPNWVHDLRPLSGRRGYLYLGWRRSQASDAVTSRCCGKAKRCRQTHSGRSCKYTEKTLKIMARMGPPHHKPSISHRLTLIPSILISGLSDQMPN
jgi:hypothetical protein